MKVKVILVGCDDETEVMLEMSKEELDFLKRLQAEVNETSTYGCMPTLTIREVENEN